MKAALDLDVFKDSQSSTASRQPASRHTGVTWSKGRKAWQARIYHGGKVRTLVPCSCALAASPLPQCNLCLFPLAINLPSSPSLSLPLPPTSPLYQNSSRKLYQQTTTALSQIWTRLLVLLYIISTPQPLPLSLTPFLSLLRCLQALGGSRKLLTPTLPILRSSRSCR